MTSEILVEDKLRLDFPRTGVLPDEIEKMLQYSINSSHGHVDVQDDVEDDVESEDEHDTKFKSSLDSSIDSSLDSSLDSSNESKTHSVLNTEIAIPRNTVNVRTFTTRWEWLYELNDCPLDTNVYCNDFDVWKDNWLDPSKNSKSQQPLKKWLWVYDKLKLCKSFKIKSAPIGVYPEDSDFPVIVKPILNLYGSGRGVLQFKSREDLAKFSRSELGCGMMWMPYFTGDHRSLDVVLQHGTIKHYISFKGKTSERLCEYDWWESEPKYNISPEIKKWIKKTFRNKLFGDLVESGSGFTGIVHLEFIDNQLIECHLRMGHTSTIGVYENFSSKQSPIAKSTINLYSSNEWLDLPESYQTPKIFIVPLCVDYDEYQYLDNPDNDTVHNLIKNSSGAFNGVWMLQKCLPPDVSAHPVHTIKTWSIYSTDLDQALKLKNEIRELMQPKRMRYYISKTKEKLHGLSPMVFQSPFNIAIGAAIVISIFVLIFLHRLLTLNLPR